MYGTNRINRYASRHNNVFTYHFCEKDFNPSKLICGESNKARIPGLLNGFDIVKPETLEIRTWLPLPQLMLLGKHNVLEKNAEISTSL